MKFSTGNKETDQYINFMGASFITIILLIMFTTRLDSYRDKLEGEWSKMCATIRIMEFYRIFSYDQKRKSYLENRILFECIATDAIKIYTTNTTKSYNDRIIKNMEKIRNYWMKNSIKFIKENQQS